jgi:hypothetical protein
LVVFPLIVQPVKSPVSNPQLVTRLPATASHSDPPAIAGMALHNPKDITATTNKVLRIPVPLIHQISELFPALSSHFSICFHYLAHSPNSSE